MAKYLSRTEMTQQTKSLKVDCEDFNDVINKLDLINT